MLEMDEVLDIKFINIGSVGVGYEINKIKKIVVQFSDKVVIGAFYASFGQRS